MRTLHGDHGQVRAFGYGYPERLCLLFDPGQVLVVGGRVDDDAEEVFGQEIHDQVVDDAATFVEHARVQRLARRLELVDAVGEQMAQEIPRLRPAQVDHGHVRDVEHAGVAA